MKKKKFETSLVIIIIIGLALLLNYSIPSTSARALDNDDSALYDEGVPDSGEPELPEGPDGPDIEEESDPDPDPDPSPSPSPDPDLDPDADPDADLDPDSDTDEEEETVEEEGEDEVEEEVEAEVLPPVVMTMFGALLIEDPPVTDYAGLVAAISLASDGDTIIIGGNIDNFGAAITLDKSLTFQAAENDVTIKAKKAKTRHFIVSGGNITLAFDGVTLDGNGVGGGILSSATQLTLENALIRNCYSGGGSAVYIESNCALTVNGGKIYDNVADGKTVGSGSPGIYAGDNTTVTVCGAVISNNTTIRRGGGITAGQGSTVSVEDSVIEGNSAGEGGGIFIGAASVLTVKNSQIIKNFATSSDGGGINSSGAIYIIGSVISENEATTWGGGIKAHQDCTVSVQSSVINNNQAGAGGGIFVYIRTSLTIKDSELCGNVARSGGAIDAYGNNKINIEDSHIDRNIASNSGGGMDFVQSATLTMNNSTLNDNEAGKNGGGMYAFTSTVTLTDCQVIGNTAVGTGGGVHAGGYFSKGFLTMNNCQTLANTAQNGGGIYAQYYVHINGGEITENTAAEDGGGIWMDSLFLLTTDNAVFTANRAASGYLWTLGPDTDSASKMHRANILGATYTVPFTNVYSNFDVNYARTGVEPAYPALVTVNYYQDEMDGLPLGSRQIRSLIGQDTAAELGAALDADWIDLYQPPGYQEGTVQNTGGLPPTVTDGLVIEVLYIKALPPIAALTVNYYQDTQDNGGLLESMQTSSNRGEDTDDALTEALGADWPNLHRPDGYQEGEVQGTLPLTVEDGTIVDVLYLPLPPVPTDEDNVTVTYHANGGSGSMPTDTVAHDAAYQVRDNVFTREDYTFDGWNTLADGSGESYAANHNIAALLTDLQLYAQWKQNGLEDPEDPKVPDGSEEPEEPADSDNSGNNSPLPEPAGPDRNMPTPSNGGTLRANDDNSYDLIDEGGVPLGRYTQDEDGIWIFEEYVPLGKLPQTGAVGLSMPIMTLLLLALAALTATIMIPRYKHK